MTEAVARVGPRWLAGGRIALCVWAPETSSMDVVVDGVASTMQRDADGFWRAEVAAANGARYGFRLGGGDDVVPDPASHWQPDGVHALSALWNPADHRWTDGGWRGVELPGQVLYELHVGTVTADGTWRAAMAELPRLRDLGVTVVQMMPVNTYAGRFGWGYDGVFWCAPHPAYGAPGDLQAFVDRAHGLGLGVILDVVFNHFGPAGNVLGRYSPHYVTDRHANEWGDAIDYDGPGRHGTRSLVLSAIEHWVRHFHVDGFRLDATDQIVDASPEHIVQALTRTARAAAAPRRIVVVAEHEPQHATLMRPVEAGGMGLDGVFNEDIHHSWRVALTGMRDAYLTDYRGTSREWLAALRGFLYQGQYYRWQSAARGRDALDRPSWQFLAFLENHDQAANLAGGRRLHEQTSVAWWRALSALLLLGPWTPLLFQGQERQSSPRFRYFCDHDDELQQAVARGRRGFVAQFTRMQGDDALAPVEDVGRQAFEASQLEPAAPINDHPASRLHRDLLALRARLAPWEAPPLGSAPSDVCLLMRSHRHESTWLVVANLGADLELADLADPLVAPPSGCRWAVHLCTSDPQYDGTGVARSRQPWGVVATGHATTVFLAEAETKAEAHA